jgi:phosphatidate cytidylyltransferase
MSTAPRDDPKDPPSKGSLQAWLRNLGVRVATAAVGIPILLWMLYLGPAEGFALFCGAIAALTGRELGRMTHPEDAWGRAWMVLAPAGLMLTWRFAPELRETALALLVLGGALGTLLRPTPIDTAARRMGWAIAGPLYLGFSIALVASIHTFPRGGSWVVLTMVLAWVSDTGAFVTGRFAGRTPLYPTVSPNKTVEGALGGLAAITVVALVFGQTLLPDLGVMHALLLALGAGALGQAGDLCVSVLKRSTGVKDAGRILPGHGGFLDRIDALMFTAMSTFLYLRWVLPPTP